MPSFSSTGDAVKSRDGGVKNFESAPSTGIEGVDEGRWVVVDYGPLIVHLFYDFVRQEYRLEDLWKEGKELTFKLD